MVRVFRETSIRSQGSRTTATSQCGYEQRHDAPGASKPDAEGTISFNMTTKKEPIGVARERIGESALTSLFETAGPCVLAFISKMTQTPAGVPPMFPPIFG